MIIEHDLSLDIANYNNSPLVKIKQYDQNSHQLNISLKNNDVPFSIEAETTAKLRMTKPDGYTVYKNCSIADNIISVVLDGSISTAYGKAPAEIGLYKKEELLLSSTFCINIIKSAIDEGGIISSDDFGALTEIIEKSEATISACEEATQNADNATQLATATAEDIKQRADSGEFNGKNGTDGKDGAPGAQGEPGQPGADGKSATITIGTVTTVSPDTPASVTNTGTATDAIFNFEIPKGADGSGGGTDIETLEKIAIKTTIEGNPAMSGSSAEWRVPLIEGYGQSTQEADPTPEAPQEIKSSVVTGVKGTGKNLFKMPQVKEWTNYKIEYVQEIDNGLICKPKGAYANCKSGLFKLKPNTNYSLSGYIESDNLQLSVGIRLFKNILYVPDYVKQVAMARRNPVSAKNVKVNANFVTDELKDTDEFYLQLDCSWESDNNFEVKFTKIQIEYGTTATEYESYKEKTISLSAPVTLRGIPSESGNVTIDGQKYLSDYIGQKEGVYGVFRSFFVYEVTGNEDFASGGDIYQQDGSFDGYFNIVWEYPEAKDDLSATIKWGFCNFLSFNASVWSKAGEIGFCFNKNQIHIRVKNETISATQEMEISQKIQLLKDYLKNLYDSATPMIFLYPLAIKTFEVLPETDQQALKDLKTFYPTSIISWETEDNSGAWTRAEIIHDPTNYIDEQISNTITQAITLAQGGTI